MHSLDESLYDQIRRRFRAGTSKRNLLLCGSRFYEEPSREAAKPAVLRKLEDLGVFTRNVCGVALVDEGQAGAVAGWVKGGATDGWNVLPPVDARNFSRRLHAKFVYVGYLRHGCTSNGWLYLGSGNLSRRGFLTTGTMKEGNVECGVVFPVDERFTPEDLLERLFWKQDSEPIDPAELSVGSVGDKPIASVPPAEFRRHDAMGAPSTIGATDRASRQTA
jgi:hypothetical protein